MSSIHAKSRWFPTSYLAQTTALGLLYFVLAAFSIFLTHSAPDKAAVVWWPNALLLGVLLRSPRRRWPGFIAASLLANTAANLQAGYQLLLNPGFALCDLFEIGLSLFLILGVGRQLQPQRRQHDLAITMALVLCVSTPIAAFVGALLLHATLGVPVVSAWRSWWIAESIGMTSLLPIVLVTSRVSLSALFAPRRRWEFALILAVSLGTAFVAMQQMPFPLIVMTLPLLVAACRVGVLGTAIAGAANIILIVVLGVTKQVDFHSIVLAMAQHSMLMATSLLLLGPLLVALLIEQRDRTFGKLRLSEANFRDTMTYAPIGMLLVNREGVCFNANPAACTILGYSAEEMNGMNMRLLSPSDELIAISLLAREVLDGTSNHFMLERRYIRKNGSLIWAQTSVAVARDDEGQIKHFISQIENIDERKRNESHRASLQRELEHRARHDGLTGLLNRQSFEQAISDLLQHSDRTERQHSVCYIDLDRFKVINDSAGHAAGDVMLRQISQRLGQRMRSRDTLARFGGDEFGLLLPDCSADAALRIAEGIIETINSSRFNWEGRVFDIGASIGVVPFSGADDAAHLSVSELMSRADVACYTAKNQGRNRVAVYNDSNSGAARDHSEIQMAASIREALDAGRFCLYAQRIIPLQANTARRPIELLVRLRTSDGLLVPPGAFIPAAERFDLMAAIDRWVIGTALLQYGHELAKIQNLGISLNLSGKSFNDPGFADFLRAVIHGSPVSAGSLCFELTETAVINNMAQAAELMQILSDEGCSVALDDFGSGLSSFNYLKAFPAKIVKIDGSFVRSIAENPIDCAIVTSINQIAHHLGAATVAEYVETMEVADMLRDIGVDFAQGYAYHRPQPLEELIVDMLADDTADLQPMPTALA